MTAEIPDFDRAVREAQAEVNYDMVPVLARLSPEQRFAMIGDLADHARETYTYAAPLPFGVIDYANGWKADCYFLRNTAMLVNRQNWGQALDLSYLAQWAAQLQVMDYWQKLWADASSLTNSTPLRCRAASGSACKET
jgi:hypothetical protein